MVVMNKNETPINIQTKRFAEILTGKSVAKNVLTGEKVGLGKQIQVNGKSAFVYEIE